MELLATSRRLCRQFGRKPVRMSVSATPPVSLPTEAPLDAPASPLLKTVSWVSAGVGALAIGVIVGREIRQRYKFKRRTPYDLYAHSGDQQESGFDFGIGI